MQRKRRKMFWISPAFFFLTAHTRNARMVLINSDRILVFVSPFFYPISHGCVSLVPLSRPLVTCFFQLEPALEKKSIAS
ncbi:hypothetical protein F5Y16DRAFT_219914 [Xylariaceae sp. FL0255]|nr:hypothetical protein F5Y16DRAFT_219914 [Xylariaceae sp. FL0255]